MCHQIWMHNYQSRVVVRWMCDVRLNNTENKRYFKEQYENFFNEILLGLSAITNRISSKWAQHALNIHSTSAAIDIWLIEIRSPAQILFDFSATSPQFQIVCAYKTFSFHFFASFFSIFWRVWRRNCVCLNSITFHCRLAGSSHSSANLHEWKKPGKQDKKSVWI